MIRCFLILYFISCSICLFAQQYTRSDSLRGYLNPLRTCYDVTFYDLSIAIDDQEKSIERSTNIIHFKAVMTLES